MLTMKQTVITVITRQRIIAETMVVAEINTTVIVRNDNNNNNNNNNNYHSANKTKSS